MFKHYIKFTYRTVGALSYYFAALIYAVRLWHNCPDTFVNVVSTLMLFSISMGVISKHVKKYSAMMESRTEDSVMQFGKYYRFYYDNGSKLSKRYTDYMTAYKAWTKILT